MSGGSVVLKADGSWAPRLRTQLVAPKITLACAENCKRVRSISKQWRTRLTTYSDDSIPTLRGPMIMWPLLCRGRRSYSADRPQFRFRANRPHDQSDRALRVGEKDQD